MRKPVPFALEPGTKLQNGKYLVVQHLGQTFTGITYLCMQTHLNEKVALNEFFLKEHFTRRQNGEIACENLDKNVYESFRNIYLEEYRTLVKCSSNEHIVDVRDTFEENGTFYAVTTYIFEDDLRAKIKDNDGKPLNEAEALTIIRQLGDGLSFMHQQGISHLDLSPEKVLLTKKGKAMIFDIGLARQHIPPEICQDTNQLNKPGYSAPEQYDKSATQGPLTDIYSLGAILYYLLTGKDPIPANQKNDKAQSNPGQLNPLMSPATSQAILKAMETDPAKRYPSVLAFLQALQQEGKEVKKQVIPKGKKKKLLLPSLILMSVLVAATFLTIRYFPAKETENELAANAQIDSTNREDTEGLWSYGDSTSLFLGVNRMRGGRPVSYMEGGNTSPKDSVKIGRYYALLIGEEEYEDRQLKLDNPVHDAERLKKVLDSNYIFDQIILLKNPNREGIFSEFQSLQGKMTENDNLLIFYAGHGQYDARTKKGYWLPRDAKQSNISNWISNDQLKDFLSTIKARHILLITDACFGGSISRGVNNNPLEDKKLFTKMTLQLYKRKSVKSISSGVLEKVPDKSPFIQYLIDNLSLNEKNVLSGMDLFYATKASLEKGCTKEVPFPVFEVIPTGFDNGGDFFFIRRDILNK